MSRADVAQMWQSQNGQWTWHIRAGNGEIIASAGGETYNNLADLEDMLAAHFSDATRVNLTEFKEDDA